MYTRKYLVIPFIGALAAVGFAAGTFASGASPEPPMTDIETPGAAPSSNEASGARVTLEQYAAAVQAAADCGAANGLTVEIHEGTPPSWGFASATIEQGEEDRAILVKCNATHLDDVQTRWMAEHRPTEAQREAALVWVGECVASTSDAALPSTGITEDAILAWVHDNENEPVQTSTFLCLSRASEVFGFSP